MNPGRFHFVIIGLLFFNLTLGYGTLLDSYPPSVREDANLTTLKLLAKYKYPGEQHFVITEDGYVLQMFRIARPGAKPILMVHGLLDTSDTWILLGPDSALGYYMFDAGYDVWLGNVRGNRYSRNHTKLNPNKKNEFWSFSWHEIAQYDLPAMIDKVLWTTGYDQLTYFGHSQGTTTFFAMASSRPEYNAKINIMHALAPVAFISKAKIPLLSMAKNMFNLFTSDYEFLPHSNIFINTCFISDMALAACIYYYFEIVGRNKQELNMTMYPVMMGHVPAGCSSRQLQHYIQLRNSNRFGQFDFGAVENNLRYNQSTPPNYPLHLVTTPIALYYTANDHFAHVDDVKRLIRELPNVIEDHLYPDKKWNHMDMSWGITARRVAHPKMLELTKKWESRNLEELFSTTVRALVEKFVYQYY